MRCLFVISLLIVLPLSIGFAQTPRSHQPSGSKMEPYSTSPDVFGRIIKVPEHFTTIQAAINQAKEGALILVAPGTYY
ncbi:MAG: hypothetical protein KJ645_06645 [Planctomycetes bacterium]|nr:hypothetical protein [Planctomycetota bacterium]